VLWLTKGEDLLTTNLVVGETWTFLRRRLGHRAGVDFIDRVARSLRVVTVYVDEAAEAEAWIWLRRHDERSYSYADATSFAVMRKRRVYEALAFDGDFAAAGFIELRP
jgi:predicted nucleic acid-binding protein